MMPIGLAADELAELRAEIARRQLTIYHLAPFARIHPGRLGSMLKGTLPSDAPLRERIRVAIAAAAREGASR